MAEPAMPGRSVLLRDKICQHCKTDSFVDVTVIVVTLKEWGSKNCDDVADRSRE